MNGVTFHDVDQAAKVLDIKQIVIDRNLNPRLEIDKETVEHYMEVFDELPPVVVFNTERGVVLADGFHRHAAAKALSRVEMGVDIRQGTYREAMEYAATANLYHGRPLTTKERVRVGEVLLTLHPEWADRRIAKEAGCSQPTVGTLRKRLEAEGRVIKFITRTGVDGKEQAVARRVPIDPWAGRVICADAFDALAAIEGGSCDLIFVDPPYGILDEEWDKFRSTKALLMFTRRWLDLVVPKLKPAGRLFICFSQWHVHWLRLLMAKYERRDGLIYSNTIIWSYRNVTSKANNRAEFKLMHEPILYFRGRWASELDFSVYGGDEQGDVWTIATPQSNFHEGKVHPAQKPLELLRRVIATGCPKDALVLDPFAGSGTTAVAAYELMRDFRVIEKSPVYVAQIRSRLDDVATAHNGKEASQGMALSKI